jgi:2-keto-4-pentenoate hydratase
MATRWPRARAQRRWAPPANAVAWLVNMLAEREKGLNAGQIVMTGT